MLYQEQDFVLKLENNIIFSKIQQSDLVLRKREEVQMDTNRVQKNEIC